MSHRSMKGAFRVLRAPGVAIVLIAAAKASAPTRTLCDNRTGQHGGFFFTFWKSGGDACVTLGPGGRYVARYRLRHHDNLVTGRGWRRGSDQRVVGYRASAFDPGSNSYLALYGWSVDPLVEYYVVDNWGTAFTPPGDDAVALGTVTADGGVYRIFRTRRIEQPSIQGTRSFDQYWSVRTTRRSIGPDNTITLARHVAAWKALGLTLGRLDYQVVATEGFGSTGRSDVTVWRR